MVNIKSGAILILLHLIVTTTGYGNIPVLTVKERLFAIFAMITGAAACDAGIAALLSSMISDIDEQSSENSRRLKCCKKYMSSIGVDKELYDRVLSYHSYVDNDLNNISETQIIHDFSPSLRTEILKHFCFQSLRICVLFRELSDGVLLSIAESMKPYMAVPGELLSEIGCPSYCLYVLQRGMVQCVDIAGLETFLPLGSVIGHSVTRAEFDMSRCGRKLLRIELISAHGFTSRHQNPYMIFRLGSCSCRSSIIKTKDSNEVCVLKVPGTHENKLCIDLKRWQKGPYHPAIGTGSVDLNDDFIGVKQDVVIYDLQGRRIGLSLRICCSFIDDSSCDIEDGHDNTVMSIGFSHLYKLELRKVEEVKYFLAATTEQPIIDRLDRRYFSRSICECKDSNPTADKADDIQPIDLISGKRTQSSPAPIVLPDRNVQDHASNKGIRSLFDRAKRFSQTFPLHGNTDNVNLHKKSSTDFMAMDHSNAGTISQGSFKFPHSIERIQEEDSWDNLLVSTTDITSKAKISLRFFVDWG